MTRAMMFTRFTSLLRSSFVNEPKRFREIILTNPKLLQGLDQKK